MKTSGRSCSEDWFKQTTLTVFGEEMKIRAERRRAIGHTIHLMSLFLFCNLFSCGLQAQERSKTELEKAPASVSQQEGQKRVIEEGEDADLPRFSRGNIDKAEYLRRREEYIALRRGYEPGKPFDPTVRKHAILQMEQQERSMRERAKRNGQEISSTNWAPVGPAPIPNGQVAQPRPPAPQVNVSVSGRVSAIAVHPADSNIVYVGTAAGGVYRTLDGGVTWTPLLDGAQSLSIGAIAIARSQPSTVYVGTGEIGGFFGVGVYRIDNADTTADLTGPINPVVDEGNGVSVNAFAFSSISKILVHPTDPATIFVSTTNGFGGVIGSNSSPPPSSVPPRSLLGIFRSANATSASPSFTKLTVNNTGGWATGFTNVKDMVLETGNPNNLICWVQGGDAGNGGDGGVYRTTNALAASPVFTHTYTTTTNQARGQLAVNKVNSVVTVIAGTGESAPAACGNDKGMLRKSTDGGVTWTTPAGGGGYCGSQCFWDLPVAIHPNNANIVMLAGNFTDQKCSSAYEVSNDGGETFDKTKNIGLHPDAHALEFAPSNPSIVYLGNDGGIWKSTDTGNTWTSLNSTSFSATTFTTLALHPTDREFMIGGTQDNGTVLKRPDGSWFLAAFGDGGYTLIDQNATDTTSVTMYHTFFNISGNQIQFERETNVANATPIGWTTLGCGGSATANGINCADTVIFYAPMALGAGNPNTVYFGTDRLYRSTDTGTNMVVASQAPIVANVPIVSVGISHTNDNVRMVGLKDGSVWATTTGSSVLTNVTPAGAPQKTIGRVVIDPANPNTAYVTYGGFGVPAGQHLWKTTNLNVSTPAWTASGNGIPDVPVNAMVVDPLIPNSLFVGTDIGVYASTDGGATWLPFGSGLPRIPVFDMAIQSPNRVLRIATHGRGIWEIVIPSSAPTPGPVSQVNLSLTGGGAITSTTRGGTDLQVGFSTITVNSGNAPYGTAVFVVRQGNVVISEAGVPASPPTTHARIFVDLRNNVPAKSGHLDVGTISVNTGFAAVNRGNATAHFSLKLRNRAGQPLASGNLTLAQNAHLAKFVDQFAPDFVMPGDFATATQFGSIEITSDQPLSILALRLTSNQRLEGLITSTPIADQNAAVPSGSLFFPQVADGGGYKSTYILLNLTTAPISGKLHFFKSDGTPLSVALADGSQPANFTISYSIPADGTFVLQTDGSPSSVNVGWVQLTPDPGSATPVGSGVFSFSPAGTLITESGIPSATPTTHARIYIDESGGHDTGLAMANANASALSVALTAFQLDGITQVGTGPNVNLGSNQHKAAFVGELINGGLPPGFTGVLDVAASTPFAALTLRALTNSRREFLLTTFPIADATRPAPTPIVFPQIADGGGYNTQFILISTGGAVSSTLNFFGNDGSPLAVGKRAGEGFNATSR